VPESYLIDKTGAIRFKQVGPLTTSVINDTILPILERLDRWSVVLCVMAVLTITATGRDGHGAIDEPAAVLDARLPVFLEEVRCLVCQNETLAGSRADLAMDLRREIREQMEAGESGDDIRAFLTDRYGDFVLYRPPLKPTTYPLWFGPFAILVGSALRLYRQLRPGPPRPHGSPTAEEQKRARRLLRAPKKERT